ncbi:transposase [Xenorhabdus thuongxuanensis]|uniref:Transposase n=1 Tax=Xenorhabdus thuongxuanensis TaxID=1873484 RepID=A0A1Q5TU50_9GAMM|nr:transposase [Xenorhabdus thuongxuanensis]
MASFFRNAAALRQSLYEALEDASNGLTVVTRRIFKQLYEDWLILHQRTEEIEETLKLLSSQTAQWQQLQSIPGIDPLIASAFIAYVGDGKQFNNGRQLAAWLGLVPR